jgi:iron complex transport system substrate-binding protein
MTRLTRRTLIGTTAGIGTSLAVSRFASAQDASPESSPIASDGTWSFTDDKGVTVTLPSAPKRVVIDVNAAAALWDFGVRPIAVFGWLANPSGDFGAAGGNIDSSQVEIIGNGEQTIDVEALVGLEPDLVITLTFVPDDPSEYWSLAADSYLPLVQQVAPIIAMSGIQSASSLVARYAELATALGVDLASTELSDAEAGLRTAEDAFKAALAEKPGITALFVAPAADMLYVANPARAGDVMYFQELGLIVPSVTIDPANGDYWEYVSPEVIGKYETDLFYSSYRGISIEETVAIPTVAQLPAVKAGQIYSWNQDYISSYQGLTTILTDLTATITESEIVTES